MNKNIQYEIEEKYLSPYAFKSINTKGRKKPLEPSIYRTEFMRDRDRIIHCKSFRRLKHKTQVFLSPEGDHYRTRLTHTLEVMQIARSIARALRLNEDLVEAISYGHDLGHTPFGHAGERALQTFTQFEHNVQSLRVVDVLENNFEGMNLTYEVRDGILNHRKSGNPSTLEGRVVSIADRIAYINHDIDDAIRANVLKEEDLPKELTDILGHSVHDRINNMILNVINNSMDKPYVKMNDEFTYACDKLREFLFERVYNDSEPKKEEHKVVMMIKMLYEYFIENINKLPKGYANLNATDAQKVCDYIASMTDGYSIFVFNNIFVPKGWQY
ncbi:MAG TPA: deoxyguanosinetriphosphate triphosphohydrolase [Clostridia bacterium]